MSGSVVALSHGRLRRRRDRIADFLDAWGDLQVTDTGAATETRMLEFRLWAPGSALPVEIEAAYREYYRLTDRDAWTIAKYAYEYRDLVHGTRLAYHLHAVGRRPLVPHAHCEPLVDERPVDRHHLRAVELALHEAHEEFMKLYATGRSPDCGAFRPLMIVR